MPQPAPYGSSFRSLLRWAYPWVRGRSWSVAAVIYGLRVVLVGDVVHVSSGLRSGRTVVTNQYAVSVGVSCLHACRAVAKPL